MIKDEFDENLPKFVVEKSEKPILFEVFTKNIQMPEF